VLDHLFFCIRLLRPHRPVNRKNLQRRREIELVRDAELFKLQELFSTQIAGGFPMLRISAFVAVLTVLLTTGALAAPKDQSNSYPNCYSQKCTSECAAKSVYKGCEIICQRMASTKPPCK